MALLNHKLKALMKLFLALLIIISYGCSLYNDIRIDTSYNNGPGVNASITKPLSDLDSIIRALLTSANTLSSTEIDTAIQRKEFLDSIIGNYADLQYFRFQKDILIDDISNYNDFLSLINSERNPENEKFYDLRMISNNIVIKEEELVLNEQKFTNNLFVFFKLTGYKITDFDLEKMFSDINNTTQYELELKKIRVDLGNNYLVIRKKWLDNILPELSLSAGVSYDITSNQISNTDSAGINYNFAGIFRRNYESKIIEYQNENLKRDIWAKEMENEDALYSINQMIDILENRVNILEKNLLIENTNIVLYAGLYKQDKIDFYEYKRNIDNLMAYKTNLLRSKSDLFIIIKRLKYGILKGENDS